YKRQVLEAVRRGDVIPVAAATAAGPARAQWQEKGQLAPDFRAGTFRLAEHRGKPVVLVFFKPASETTDLTLAIAEAIEKRYAGKVAVAAVVVFGDVAAATRDRDRLRLTIPVQDGGAVAATYGIETVPRFAVIDSAGKVHWTFTGVGDETGFLLREQVDSLVTPLIPPVGTDYRPRRPNPLPPP
ncbi:MAG: redoxin domain-containing protein, partial [Anaerolineae bacterium]|nr:redoxin domain-containing protein [Anaerolineae bacterium]